MHRTVAIALGVALASAALHASTATADPGAAESGTPGVRLGPGGHRTVGLVRGSETDPAAERLVRTALRGAGVDRVVAVDSPRDPGTPVTVWLGDGDDALAELGVDDAEGLPAEGYVLAAGRVPGTDRAHVVLDGVDADGTFYAAQRFGRLAATRIVAPIDEREAPTMRYRGLIEGFYGTPWTHAERLDLIDYLGAHRMNTFEYAPKDDPYHREKWREPYPADALAELGELAARANENHVDFTFALSPGLSICYSSEADFQAIVAKFEALYGLGVRAFTIPLDDIDYNRWHCDDDREKYGTGGGAAGRAQADLLNRVQREWVEAKGDVAPLQMVPTEYYDVSETPYKKAIREVLDPKVIVHWTGIGVIPERITREQAAQARAVFGHPILVWDNYPVNDYIAGRLPLAPYTGRENGLSHELVGIVSNPMNQAATSKIALFSFGEFGWDDLSYDAEESWQRALAERAGGDARTLEALRWFADLQHYDGTLHKTRAPRLTAAIEEFWRSERDAAAVDELRATFAAIGRAPDTIRRGVRDAGFVEETKVWLDATASWADAMRVALDGIVALDDGDVARGWDARQRAAELVDRAEQLRDVRLPHANTHPRIADGVADAFVDEVARRFDEHVGVGSDRAQASSSLGTYADHEPSRMVDRNLDSWYWSDRAPVEGDFVQVDLGRVRPIGDIAVAMAKSGSPDDYLRSGVLEYSTDGDSWTELARGSTPEVTARAPEGTTARYVRYRALADNEGFWLVVREFSVEVLDGTRLTVSGGPEPADGSALTMAADDDLGSAYVAARRPAAGEALEVEFSTARVLERLRVLATANGVARARVEARTTDGVWHRLGVVRRAYTDLEVPASLQAAPVEAVRLVWERNTGLPRVAEVVPRFANGAR